MDMPPRKPKSIKRRLRVSRVGGVMSGRRPRAAKSKRPYKGCPLKVTIECFSWPPITVTAQTLGLTPEQVEKCDIKPGHRLYWCSECRCVYYLSNNFAYIIGKREVEGSDFIPGELRSGRYIGGR